LTCLALAGISAAKANAQVEYPVDLRIGGITGSTRRDVSINDEVTDRLDASVKGIEAYIGAKGGGMGIGGRIMNGTYGTVDFTQREARLFVGENWFRLEGAYGERSLSGTDSTVLFIRAGARSIVQIGGTGVSISISGAKTFQGDFSHSRSETTRKPDGWEGESSVMYTAPKIPVYVQLGYRADYFKYRGRAEHMNGVVFGMGIWLGGR
ncbi:MAG TPA: hypothetical protein VF042_13360, partial [Gemmatimonadaceae bacterium]